MPLLGLVVVALVLLLPAPAAAQSVKAADLIGTWIGTDTTDKGESTGLLVFRADSSYCWWNSLPTQAPNPLPYDRPWELRGDTLWLRGGPSRIVTLEGQQLTLTYFGLVARPAGPPTYMELEKIKWHFRRAEAPKAPEP